MNDNRSRKKCTRIEGATLRRTALFYALIVMMACRLGICSSKRRDKVTWAVPVHHSRASRHKRKLMSRIHSNHKPIIESSLVGSELEDPYRLRFTGVGRLYESPLQSVDMTLHRLQHATVAVIGVGGVGSWAAEALVRSGVGNLVLVDCDDICISNTNRQLHALSTTVGQFKIDAMRQRLLQINPDCNVTLVYDFVDAENARNILDSQWTAVLDAIDGSRGKAALLAACADLRLPVVTCGAAAGRVDPTQLRVDDLSVVEGDKLLASCRKELRKHHGFPQGFSFRDKQKLKRKPKKFRIETVYSLEEQRKAPISAESVSSLRICDSALGTACFLTGTYGFVAAGRIIDMIAKDELRPPYR